MARITVGPAAEVGRGESRMVELEGRPVAVFNVEGRYLAIEGHCPHAGAPWVGAGTIEGERIRCEWHGICFDLCSGQSDSGFAIAVYEATVDGDGLLQVELPDSPRENRGDG